jgi:hypothetical protein
MYTLQDIKDIYYREKASIILGVTFGDYIRDRYVRVHNINGDLIGYDLFVK